MKIFINTTNWAIVKTENEFPSVVGDNYVDTLKVYYDVNPSTALIYPTITLLKPNGRKVGAFPFDAGTVENPVPFAYTDADSNTWYGFAFTLSSDDGQLTSVGRYQVTITTNKYKVVGTAPNESQVITNQRNTNIQLEVMNAVLNDNSDILILGESVDDVVASMYQLCQTLELDFASLTNSKADRSNIDQTIIADWIKVNKVIPYSNQPLILGDTIHARITIREHSSLEEENYIEIESDDLVGISSDTKVKLGVNDYATKIEITDERVKIDSPETAIAQLRIMQPDGVGGDITVSGNNATEVFTNDGLNIQSKTKIGNTSGDYWQFYGDTLSLKGSSHIIESNSGNANIGFDDTELELYAEDRLYLRSDDEIEFSGGVRTALIIDENGARFPHIQSGTPAITYDWVFFGGNLSANKTPYGGSTTTIMALNPEQGLIVKNDLLDVDPSQYMVKNITPFRVGIKTGGTSDSTTGTYVSFNNSTSQIDFKTANTLSDSIYMNGVKLTNKTYVDTQDNNLQSQIDGLNAGQNLADIVANLTALNNLDITNLKNGDKVQVLVDSNHDNASTVYSLVINGNTHSWSYIGKYGQDGYTKAEENALLALKADLTNTSQTITTDAVKVNEIQPNQGGFLLNADTVSFKSYTSQGGSGDYPAGTYQWVQSGADLVLGKNNSDALIALSPVGLVVDTDDMLMNPQNIKSKTGALNIGLYNSQGMHNDLVITNYANNSITNTITYDGVVSNNQSIVREDYVRLSYNKFEVAYNTVDVDNTGVLLGVGLAGNRKYLQFSSSTKKLTLDGNEIIDTNNATTELFLTDGEMTTLLSEVFD